MLRPLIPRPRNNADIGSNERGFTLALVTVALLSILGMAALSIDIGTLYQAKAEAQRSADTAALAAARVISLSGITADPTSGSGGDRAWSDICGGAASPATLTAQAIAEQNTIAGVAPSSSSITVTYGAGSGTTSNADCSTLGTEFANNPIVNVTVQRSNLPIFFARVFSLIPGTNYSGSGVSATASAEVYNPSGSGAGFGGGGGGGGASVPTPVQPRCVKPWIIPNADPIRGGGFGNGFVHQRDGALVSPGISGLGETATVGETFYLSADCNTGGSGCNPPYPDNPPIYNGSTLDYIPAHFSGTPGAVPSCANSDLYQEAIGGCDETTVYACGVGGGTSIDLTDYNPGGGSGDTSTATQCLIHQSSGQDSLAPGSTPPNFPFQIQAGAGSALFQAGLVNSNDIITSSNSIVSIPIAAFDNQPVNSGSTVTIVGFLQVFINKVDTTTGNVNVTVLNVSGCGDAAIDSPVYGSSPVPVRLITPP